VGESAPDIAAELSEIARLNNEVAHWRRRAEVAEAKAEEQDRALQIAENALRALNPGSSTRVEPPRQAEQSPRETTAEGVEEMPPYTPSPEVPVLPREAAQAERDSWWRRFWRGPST
jgi:predicted  nucleic acid-binding Zn-ribbon protein